MNEKQRIILKLTDDLTASDKNLRATEHLLALARKHSAQDASDWLNQQGEITELNLKLAGAYRRLRGATTLLGELARERDEAREIAEEACQMLNDNKFQVNYPPMPWDEEDEL